MFWNKKDKSTDPAVIEAQRQAEAQRVFKEGMLTIKDIIAPAAMKVDFGYVQVGNYFLRSFFVYSYPRILYADWLSPVVNSEFSMNTSIFIYPIATKDTLNKLRSKSAQIASVMSEDRLKGKVRDPLMETAAEDVEELRDALQRGESRLFKASLYFTIYAKTLEELDSISNQLEGLLGSTLVLSKPTLFQQEQGLNSTLPIAKNDLMITKNLDTGALSTLFPFSSGELSQNEGILYGINQHTSGLVLFDRFNLENANSVVLAMAGSGKSYAVKLEILRYLLFGTEVIVIDPENEYERLCNAVGGSYLKIDANSDYRINPFDLPRPNPEDPEENDDSLRSTVIMLHSLIKVMLGGELDATEDNLLDEALVQTYASKGITKDPNTHNLTPPTIGDLVKILSSIKGAERVAASLEKYSEGSFAGVFNQQTNVDLNNRFIVFSIRDLEEQLRPIAMFMVLNFIWNRIKSSRKRRVLAVDEAWLLMKYDDSAQFLFSMAKRGRKYYLGVTTIVQDVEDFLSSRYGRAIINNSAMSFILKQHPAAIDLVAETFNLTVAEKRFLLNCEVGEGLFFAGQNHIAMKTAPSYQEDLLITTNPEQLNKMGG